MKIDDINADYWVNKLELQPHIEGGYFIEYYRSKLKVSRVGNYSEEDIRTSMTSIYFLLKSGQKSKLHKLKSDELWYYHSGDPLTFVLIDMQGNLTIQKLGKNIDNGESLYLLFPANHWGGALMEGEDTYSLFSCAVAPGYEYEDMDLADRETLLETYPQHKEIIIKLT